MREMDEGGVGEVHGPVAIAGHQAMQGIQVIIGDGGHRMAPDRIRVHASSRTRGPSGIM